MNRRAFVKMGIGSVSASLIWPVLAQGKSGAELLNTVVVYHENAPEGTAFFGELLDRGAEPFPIGGILDPARKNQLYRRLQERPSLVMGLTDQVSAFELQMAAGDAFHFKVPEDQVSIQNRGDGSLVAWAVAPIAEIRKGGGA